ncbi:unnamed protein product [Wuchereria bancrofti]|uniref:IFT121 second beta-propeller domain-containing protein n=1 Tax=Wuchereria bancrofti TaxID=6293 RepID=A0A3P7EPT6_WUCBA|nr:unnamed protein product [Wuchereria bancrofti]
MCRDSGVANYYSLPEIKLQSILNLGCRVEKLELNCSGTRIAALTAKGLKLFELRDNTVISLYLERTDAWNIKWDSVNISKKKNFFFKFQLSKRKKKQNISKRKGIFKLCNIMNE